VEMTGALPELKRNPGILSWKIRDKGEWFGSMEDVPQVRTFSLIPSCNTKPFTTV
jgi:multisite-specific tRNA:(cytosine-C5)-methyltransferase